MSEESLKNKAYKYIKDKIFSCEYYPGDFLDEKLLINEIGASRTPIREALNKIEQENLIQIIPKKGVMVKHVTVKNVIEIFQLRETLEPTGILNYGENLNIEQIKEFRTKFSREIIDAKEAYKLDDNFHDFLISCYNNSYIDSIMQDIYGQNNRIRVLSGKFENCVVFSQVEHIKIVDYMLEKDFLNASNALKEHLLLSKQRTMATLYNI